MLMKLGSSHNRWRLPVIVGCAAIMTLMSLLVDELASMISAFWGSCFPVTWTPWVWAGPTDLHPQTKYDKCSGMSLLKSGYRKTMPSISRAFFCCLTFLRWGSWLSCYKHPDREVMWPGTEGGLWNSQRGLALSPPAYKEPSPANSRVRNPPSGSLHMDTALTYTLTRAWVTLSQKTQVSHAWILDPDTKI